MRRLRRKLRAFLFRFGLDERGVTAVEFAFVGPVFLLFLLGTIEVALLFSASIVTEGAVIDAARAVRTGQAQNSGDPIGTFRTRLCDALVVLVDCNDTIFDVQTFNNFGAISLGVSLNADGDPVDENDNVISETFSPGGPSDIVMVRVIYTWDFFTPFIGHLFPTSANNSVLQVSTTVFRSEPYEGL